VVFPTDTQMMFSPGMFTEKKLSAELGLKKAIAS
jgi:hypothetical protein